MRRIAVARSRWHNEAHNITPKQVTKKSASILDLTGPSRQWAREGKETKSYRLEEERWQVAERSFDYLSQEKPPRPHYRHA